MLITVKRWYNALYTIPREQDLVGADSVTLWLAAARASVVIMTALSGIIGGLLAAYNGYFNWAIFGLTLFGLVLTHAASNLVNDYWDSRHGLDSDDSFRIMYGPHPLKLFTTRQVLIGIGLILLVAAFIGAYLSTIGGWFVVAITIVGGAILLLYAGDPLPLKYIGLGELAVLIVWGPLMIGGTYYLLAGNLPWQIIVASLPYAFGVTSVLFGKHIDKIDFDTRKGIHTLPIILGEKNARRVTQALVVLMYVSTLFLIAIGFLSPWLLLVLLALPFARDLLARYSVPRPKEPPQGYRGWPLWFVRSAFVHNRRFGMFFVLGLLIQVLARVFFQM